MGRPDALKVVDHCLEEQQEADQSHDPESGLLLVRTVYSGVVCPIHHVYLHPSVFGDTVVPHGLLDSGLESGQSGPQDIGMWEWQHEYTVTYMFV